MYMQVRIEIICRVDILQLTLHIRDSNILHIAVCRQTDKRASLSHDRLFAAHSISKHWLLLLKLFSSHHVAHIVNDETKGRKKTQKDTPSQAEPSLFKTYSKHVKKSYKRVTTHMHSYKGPPCKIHTVGHICSPPFLCLFHVSISSVNCLSKAARRRSRPGV